MTLIKSKTITIGNKQVNVTLTRNFWGTHCLRCQLSGTWKAPIEEARGAKDLLITTFNAIDELYLKDFYERVLNNQLLPTETPG